MPRIKMTDAVIKRLKAPAVGQVDYFDIAFPALALRITAKDVRTWNCFGRVHGKQKRVSGARWPGVLLAGARRWGGETTELMRQGIDPTAVKRAARTAAHDSFEAVLAEWLKRDQGGNRSVAEVKRLIEREALPAWRRRRLATIGRPDALAVIDAVADRG